MDRSAVATLLVEELGASQDRLAAWLKSPDFVKPLQASVPDPTFKTWPARYVAQIVTLFLSRLSWNARAVHVLVDRGLGVQAQPVARAALESTIDLRYISTNPQTLVTKWCLFEEIERYRYWSSEPDASRPPDFGFSEKQVALRLKQLDKHRPLPADKSWTLRKLAGDWDQSNLADRDKKACQALGVESASLYGMYKLLSGNLHGGVESANDFVVALGKGKFQVVSGIEGRKRVFVPWLTAVCLDVSIDSARRCGAYIEAGVEPRWDSLGVTPGELSAAAIDDFTHAQPQKASI